MAKIRKNRRVRNAQDVQVVITYAIFTQTRMFTKQDIEEKVEELLKFSGYGKSGMKRKQIDLPKMIEENLQILKLMRSIRYNCYERKYECVNCI